MRNYLRDLKHVIGFAAILVTLLVGMTFVVAGNAAVVPAGNNVAVGAAVVQPAVPPAVLGTSSKSAFNRPLFNRPAFNRPFFNRPAFVRPVFNPFFAPAISPFVVSPFFTPFVVVDDDAFGVDFD